MIDFFKKPSVETEALKIIKFATWTFAIFAIILFLNDFANKQQNYIFYGVEFSLIFLLKEFKGRIFSVLLAIKYCIPILFSTHFAISNNTFGFINLPLIHLFLLFLCYRCFQASQIIHGKYRFQARYIQFAWVAYLISISIVYGYFTLITFFSDKPILLDFIDLPFTIVGLLGLFGYVFKIRILNSMFWKISLFIIVVWDSFLFFQYPRQGMPDDTNIFITVGAAFFIILLILPAYTALYLYGYKSMPIWNKNNT